MIAAQALRLLILLFAIGITIAYAVAGQTLAAVLVSGIAWLLYLLGTLRPSCSWFGPIITHMPGDEVAITIDDGPDPKTTPELLSLLHAAQVRATFFIIGQRAAAHPDLVEAIQSAGHAIGNHTQTHPQFAFWALGPWKLWREIHQCQSTLQHRPVHFRSPVGHTNPFVQPILQNLGLHRIGWSARGYDAVRQDISGIMDTLRPNLQPGAIILIHDATPVAVDVLRHLLAEIQRRGLRTALLPHSKASHPGGESAGRATS